MSEHEPWYVTAFRQEYLEAYPHRTVEAARREASHLYQSGLRGRVLDLCCGYGRHTLALLELGLDAYGIDLSADLLGYATTLEGGAALRHRLVRADARRIPMQTASVDGVVNLFSSFGYFGDVEDRIVLDEIARILRGTGLFVVDLMNPERVRRTLVASSDDERGGTRLRADRSFAPDGRSVIKEVRLSSPDGTVRTWRETVRLYERAEIEALLLERGFTLTRVEGDFDGSGATPDSPRQIFFARKRSAQ